MRLQIFSLSKNTATPPLKTLITKVSFYIYKTGKKNFPGGVPKPPRDLSMSAPTWAYQPKPILHWLSFSKFPIKTHAILFGSGRIVEPDQTKLGSIKAQQISHLETSSITNINRNPPNTQSPHPCNSSSCPQARRPTEATHSFSFSMVTPLVNMSTEFLDPQIFSSITSLSSTR